MHASQLDPRGNADETIKFLSDDSIHSVYIYPSDCLCEFEVPKGPREWDVERVHGVRIEYKGGIIGKGEIWAYPSARAKLEAWLEAQS